MSDYRFDVSIVLNIHAGTEFLSRTMRSFEEAVELAQLQGLKVEVLFVMDRSPKAALDWVRRYDGSIFDRVRIFEVDNGSLGLSRDNGMRLADGEYIMFGDEDDLVSFNCIVASHNQAVASAPRTIVIPQYLFGFGTTHFLAGYRGSEAISPLAFMRYHPYISRLFIHSSARQELSYGDVRLSKAYAYEDWHFNAGAVAKGYTFAAAPDTILFYRQHESGLFQASNRATIRQIPPTPLFAPKTYLRVCRDAFAAFNAGGARPSDLAAMRREFLGNRVCRAMTRAANQIEPSIDLGRVENTTLWSNDAGDLRLGAAYYRACRHIGSRRFTDVFLAAADGSESEHRRLRTVVDGLGQIDPDARSLILTHGAHPDESSAYADLDRVTWIDLSAIAADLDDADVDVAALRLIEGTTAQPRLHLFSCPFTHRFFRTFKLVLQEAKAIYYREPDWLRSDRSLQFEGGENFEFLSQNAAALQTVVYDCERSEIRDRRRLDTASLQWRRLNRRARQLASVEEIATRRRPRVYWAGNSRDVTSRNLMREVGHRLAGFGANVVIETEVGPQDFPEADVHRNLSYVEGQSSDAGAYDALIWGSVDHGMPDAVADALAQGIPVIVSEFADASEAVADRDNGVVITGGGDVIEKHLSSILLLANDHHASRKFAKRARASAGRFDQTAFLEGLRAVIA